MQTPNKKKITKRPDVRSLKIHPKFRKNECSETMAPEIRLYGSWLGKLGFIADQRVHVTTMNKLLIIRLEE